MGRVYLDGSSNRNTVLLTGYHLPEVYRSRWNNPVKNSNCCEGRHREARDGFLV